MSQHIIDTNVIIRCLIKDDSKFFIQAKQFLDQVKSGKIKCHLEQAVFTEVVFVLSSYYEVPREKIADVLHNLLFYKGMIVKNKDVFLLSLDIYKNSKLHIVDSLLAANSQIHNLKLMSFDEELLDLVKES